MIINPDRKLEALLVNGTAPADQELLEKLAELSVPFEESGGVLHLDPSLDPLDEEQILSHLVDLVDDQESFRFEIHREIDSTNTRVLSDLYPGELFVCLAEMQSAGKGRRGRQWISPFGRNVYLTVGRYMKGNMSELEGLSLVVGMQAVDALRELGLKGVGLKWPNDLLLESGKLGGILVEIKSREPAGSGVVMGTGINLAISHRDAEQIDQSWSAASSSLQIPRNRLAGVFACRLISALGKFDAEGFAPFADRWNDYNLYSGMEVRILRGGQESVGIDRGVDDCGNLLLEMDSGIEVHNSGEVSLRPVIA